MYGRQAGHPLLETYVPIIHPDTSEILGVYDIYQDYQPLKIDILKEATRASVTHIFLLFVFAVLFYRYGSTSSRLLESQQQMLIRSLEDRVDERTVELKRSRDRISDLLKHKDEMYRELMLADEYKKNFLGLVSHELRTPLAVLKGYLTLMGDGSLGPENGETTKVLAT